MAEQLYNSLITPAGTPDMTLNGSINNSVTSVVVHTVPGNVTAGNFRIRIDDEIMTVTGISSLTLTVVRASENATQLPAASHGDGASVYIVPTASGVSQYVSEHSGLVLLEEHTASSSATLDFTTFISSTYDEYLIELINIVPTVDSQLWLRMGTGVGPTYDTGNNYTHCTFVWNATGTAFFGANAVAEIILNYANAGDGISVSAIANWSYNGHLRLFNPGGSTFKFVNGQAMYVDSISTVRTTAQIQGSYEVTTAVTALRFLMSTGNIASGTIRIYGLSK